LPVSLVHRDLQTGPPSSSSPTRRKPG
jgi:hypothetical protein